VPFLPALNCTGSIPAGQTFGIIEKLNKVGGRISLVVLGQLHRDFLELFWSPISLDDRPDLASTTNRVHKLVLRQFQPRRWVLQMLRPSGAPELGLSGSEIDNKRYADQNQ